MGLTNTLYGFDLSPAYFIAEWGCDLYKPPQSMLFRVIFKTAMKCGELFARLNDVTGKLMFMREATRTGGR